MPRPPVRAAIGATLIICALFALSADGLRAYFTPDDMMNLYGAWSASPLELLQGHRPLGGLLYCALFALFGLNPLPFRIVCYLLLAGNLALLYCLCRRLAGSREVAVLACLLGAYHAHLADLYYSTGTLYDLMGLCLILATLVYYLRIRDADSYPNGQQSAVLVALYLCGLAAKEPAVIVPPLIVLYEWLYHARRPYTWDALRRWLARGAWFLYVSVPLTVLYIVFRTMSGHAMTNNPDFTPHLTLHAWLAAWKHYLGDLFYGAVAFNSFKTVFLFAAMLGVALWTRRRDLLFGWCFIQIAALPFILIQPRGFFEMYMTLPGWYLYTASALVLLRDGLMRRFPQWAERLAIEPAQLALFVLVAALLLPLHTREKPLGNTWVPETHAQVRELLEQLQHRHDPLPHGATVLFLSDPYPVDEWLMTFVFRLYYHDKTIRVDRVKPWPDLAKPETQAQYDRVYVLNGKGLQEIRRKQ
jgi:hypothetical protein